MASSNTGKKNTSKAKSSTKSKTAQPLVDNSLSPETKMEIAFFVMLAFCLFLLLSSFGICGVVGNYVAGFFFGIFGAITYILPIYVIISLLFLMANGGKRRVVQKVIWSGVALIDADFILQLINGVEENTAKSLYMDGFHDKVGGGIIFGGIASLLGSFIGKAGLIIIVVLLLFVIVIEVTEISVLEYAKSFAASLKGRVGQGYSGYDDEEEYEEYEEYEQDNLPDKRGRRKKLSPPADDYDDYDDYEDYAPARKKKGNILDSIKVTSTEATQKGYKKRHKNKRVPDEEMRELKKETTPPEMPNTMGVKNSRRKKTEKEEDEEVIILHAEKNIDDDFGSFPIKGISGREKDDDDIPDEENDPLIPDFIEKRQKTRTETKAETRAEAGSGTKTEIKQETKREAAQKTEEATRAVSEEIEKNVSKVGEINKPKKEYRLPPVSLLKKKKNGKGGNTEDDVRATAKKLKDTLESFGVSVSIMNCSVGPAVTRYELQPDVGVKVGKITALADDIKLALAAADIRIEAPIPGKSAVGIEVPNSENSVVSFRELVESEEYKNSSSKLTFAVGKDIGGKTVVTDLAKMPHLLVAGATGSGKSVCINTLIMSILYKSTPDEVRLLMIDPKMVELTSYNGIPHLMVPVVTDPKKAAGTLNWAVAEMTKRYQLFSKYNVKNLKGFNTKAEAAGPSDENPDLRVLPQIVIIVDELADLMMVAHGEVEDAIVRLTQLARAAGIHLVIATQRPSVDVITGLIKANVPSRIAFAVSSGVDSRTILDMNGAEKLLGKGDMLFFPTGMPKPERVQGALVDDEECLAVVEYIKKQNGESQYDEAVSQSIDSAASSGGGAAGGGDDEERYDEYFEDAGRLIIEKDKASIGMLQRMFRIGFNRAARIMDQLADAGVVGPEEGTKPRKVLMTMDQFEEFVSL